MSGLHSQGGTGGGLLTGQGPAGQMEKVRQQPPRYWTAQIASILYSPSPSLVVVVARCPLFFEAISLRGNVLHRRQRIAGEGPPIGLREAAGRGVAWRSGAPAL